MKKEYLNKRFKVIADIPALCCGFGFYVGATVKVWKHHSKNRLYVKDLKTNYCHNIKRQVFDRCTEAI